MNNGKEMLFWNAIGACQCENNIKIKVVFINLLLIMELKIIVLIIYLGILLIIGLSAGRRVKNMSDFYVGGKKMGFWVVAFSARATGESAWLLIGLTGMGAMAGLSAYWVVLGELLGVAISWLFMARPFKRLSDKYQSITIPDYLESHFNTDSNRLRILAASILSIFVIIYVSSQIDATGIAFEAMLGFNYYFGACLGFGIVLIYLFFGGFIASVWSDFFQGILMFFGLVLLPVVVWMSMDNRFSILSDLQAIDPALINIWVGNPDPLMNVFTILGFGLIGIGFLGSPQVYVRFMSVKNESEIKKGKWVAIMFTLLTDAAAVTIGILARVIFTEYGQDAETILGVGGKNVLSMMSDNFLPALLTALYISVVLAAIMSTIDSLLMVASSAVTRDFYQKVLKKELSGRRLTKLSRVVTVGIALVALGIALLVAVLSPDRQVFWFIIFGWSGIAATFCPVMILSIFWKGFTEQGAIAAMITGFLSVVLIKFVFQNMEGIGSYFEAVDVLGPSFATALIAGFVFSKMGVRR